MKRLLSPAALLFLLTAAFLTGCETTNAVPYKASTDNIISIQQKFGTSNKTVRLSPVRFAYGVDERPQCRLLGPVKVAPGKSIAAFVEDAFKEELFLARAYSPSAETVIETEIQTLTFSSFSPASWTISVSVSSNTNTGYDVVVEYPFSTSFTAIRACKNVADAFGPAVQQLIGKIVAEPGFNDLAGL